MTGQECEKYIESSSTRDSLDIMIITEVTILTNDFRKDRVRIFVNEAGFVDVVPGRG
jgi:Potato inhibitor I family